LTNSAVYIYGQIEQFGDVGSVSASDVVDALKTVRGNVVEVRLNSPGGQTSEGLAIYHLLKSDKRRVVAYIDGLAASIASIIALSADEVVMAPTASFFIHSPWASIVGGSGDMRALADEIDRQEKILVGIYSARTGLPKDEIIRMMTDETWLGAEDAVRLKFADRIEGDLAIAACAPLSKEALARLIMKDPNMTTETVMAAAPDAIAAAATAERTRASTISAAVGNAKLPQALAAELIANGVTVEKANERIIAEFAAVNAAGTGPEIRNVVSHSWDSPQSKADAVADAIYAKLSRKEPSGPARPYMAMTLPEMSASLGSPRGWLNGSPVRASGGGMHVTGDFPNALGNAVGRQLVDQMKAIETGATAIAKTVVVNDFRQQTAVSIGAFPSLLQVNEGGEITAGTIDDHGETYAVSSFARMICLSFQALTNDDLGAVDMAIRNIAFAAADLRANIILSALSSTMTDSFTLFNAAHGNLAATGAAMDVDTLGAARTAMRLQKAMDGVTPLGLSPKILLVPAALETDAEKLVASIQPVESANVNPFVNRLTVAVEPRLDASDDAAWMLFSDPMAYETIRLAVLAGYEAPRLEQDMEFNRLGVSWRVHWHIGAAPIDHRGAYRNPGE
jgi:ATP-dependent protease ClpP protease subunit/phage major head subunit gpT-like protein